MKPLVVEPQEFQGNHKGTLTDIIPCGFSTSTDEINILCANAIKKILKILHKKHLPSSDFQRGSTDKGDYTKKQ